MIFAMVIRDATKDDLPAIVAIYNEAIPEGRATADLEPIMVESRHTWFRSLTPTVARVGWLRMRVKWSGVFISDRFTPGGRLTTDGRIPPILHRATRGVVWERS